MTLRIGVNFSFGFKNNSTKKNMNELESLKNIFKDEGI